MTLILYFLSAYNVQIDVTENEHQGRENVLHSKKVSFILVSYVFYYSRKLFRPFKHYLKHSQPFKH
jgi:hypothetical protein